MKAKRFLLLIFNTLNALVNADAFNRSSGIATLTHYDLPLNYIASCGCVGKSTHYPTAAVNALFFGSQTSFGPACGICYRIQLLSTPNRPLPPLGDGQQFPLNDDSAPQVIVKITDACPIGGPWCSQTEKKPNDLGSFVHFDLAWPSTAIPKNFFPLDSIHLDYGIWKASYDQVDCSKWAGWNDREAWGSQWIQQDSACCPASPGKSLVSTDFGNVVNISAQSQYCPAFNDRSMSTPNTSNILSRTNSYTPSTNSATSAFGQLNILQTFLAQQFPFVFAA